MAERLKNALLLVLLALMAGLLALTFLVSVQGSYGGQPLLQSLKDKEEYALSDTVSVTAYPEVLALLGPEGLFLAQQPQDYSLLYQQAEPLWQEALGSAGQLEPVVEREYLALLQAPALLIRYHEAQPLYVLQAWGGSETLQEDISLSGGVLVARGEEVILLITDREGGRWQARTAASYADLETLCAGASGVNSVLAGHHPVLAGDEVLTRQSDSFACLESAAPELVRRGELSQSVQALFGMNAYLTKVYPNADGSLVYVESHNTVSLSTQGQLSYSGEGIQLELSAQEQYPRQAEICRQVHGWLTHLWELAGASGQLSLEKIEFEGQRGVLRFGLHLNGRFLERTEGYWATVTVEDGVITGVTAALRQVTETDSIRLLPLYHAAATLEQGRGSLRVRLLEQADGILEPRICLVTEE